MLFQQRFVSAGNKASRVSRQIGEFDNKPRKARSRPARFISPDGKVFEQLVDDRFRRSGEIVANGSEGCQGKSVLRFQHLSQEIIFASEMMIQSALRNCGSRSDLVHAYATIPASAE